MSASFLACATNATIADGDAGLTTDAPIDPGTTADAAPTCIEHCTANAECQSSCPSISGDVNCCDTSTGRCYLSAATSCPAPVVDAGVMPPPY